MPANLENSAVSTGLEKVNFHSNLKEGQCQRMFKLLHNCTHLPRLQSNAQNSASQVSTVREPGTSQIFKLDLEKAEGTRDQIANICWIIGKQGNSRKAFTSTSLTTLKILCGSQQTVENS